MKIILIEVLIILILSSSISYSQLTNTNQPQGKIALVIGNGSYISSELANPENDARAMKTALQSVGFTVMEYENLDQSQMKKAMDDFGIKLKSYDVGLFFYAGHGIQAKGYNYLIPVDAKLQSEQQVEYDCVQADRILALMEASGTKVNIIILDACRNNPFERSWTRSESGKGLAFMTAPSGTLIAYATSPGSTASDGGGNNGLYTSAILESMNIPNITILEMFQNVRSIVSQKSSKQQIPWESTSMTGNFYFNTTQNDTSDFQKEIRSAPIKEISAIDEKDYIIDSRDNERYKIVKIGTQVWMAENLKTIKYRNGDLIGTTSPASKDISGESKPKYQWAYDGIESNVTTYGRLYTWYALNDSRKVCPTGWHIPSKFEWTILINYLGSDSVAGGKIKETGTSHWLSPNIATNETGFTALPGGLRHDIGEFSGLDVIGSWWSFSEKSTKKANRLLLFFYDKTINELDGGKMAGLSVRCVQDS